MKKLFLFSIITLVFFASNLLSQDRLKEAEDLIKKKDYNKAFNIAEELFKEAKYGDVERILIQLKEKEPANSKILELLGDSYTKSKVYALGLDNYLEAEKLDPQNIDLKFKISAIYYKEKDYKEAGNKLLDIYQIDSTNKKALLELSLLFYQAKWYPDAALYLKKLLLQEEKLEYYQWIVRCYMELRNYASAFEYGEKGLNKYPGDATLQRNVFSASLALAGSENEYLLRASKLANEIPDSLLQDVELEKIAKIYRFISKNDTLALEFYLRAIEKSDTLKDALEAAGALSFKLKKFDLAVQIYQKKLEKDSMNFLAAKYLGAAYLQSEKYEEAVEAYKKAISISDDDASVYYWLAQCYAFLKKENDAIEVFNQLITKFQNKEEQFKKELLDANRAIALKYLANKRYDASIPYLKRLVQLQPNSVDFNLWLGSAYHQTEQFPPAIEQYKRVLKLDPKNKDATKALKSLGEL